MRKQKDAKQKQRRDNPPRFDLYAAALYWVVKLIFEIWNQFNR